MPVRKASDGKGISIKLWEQTGLPVRVTINRNTANGNMAAGYHECDSLDAGHVLFDSLRFSLLLTEK